MDVRAPSERRTYYKVVAVVGGKYVSIFDGQTRYELGQVTAPPGGCWVCPSLDAVTRHALRLPLRSALRELPRAILRATGWNDLGFAPPVPEGHPPSDSTGDKLLVSHVQPLDVLPYEELMAAAKRVGAPSPASGISSASDAATLISAFERAFPHLSLHLLRCAGQLSVACGLHSYDPSAWLTFHSCGGVWAPAPLSVRAFRDAEFGGPAYPLAAALLDVEACLAWMVDASKGPCDLLLCAPGGAMWEEEELVHFQARPTSAAPRTLRGGASPMAALLPPATWQGERTYRVVEVPNPASAAASAAFPLASCFPRLCALVAPPAAATPSAEADATSTRARVKALRRPRGFTVGTSHAASGGPCAELVSQRRSTWQLSHEHMESVAGVLAALEMQLPAVAGEARGHVAAMRRLAASELAPRALLTRPSERRLPSPRRLDEVFPPKRFPPAEQLRARQQRDDPAGYEQACRAARARLFAHEFYRSGAFFEMDQREARAKLAGGDAVLDALDLAVLGPPQWSGAPISVGLAAPERRWRY